MLRATLLRCALVSLVGGAPAAAGAQQQCHGAPPVSIVVVASGERAQRYAAELPGATVVRRDGDTVVFQDGRVVTADIGAVGSHLNALGWASRPIEIVGSFAQRSARAAAPG